MAKGLALALAETMAVRHNKTSSKEDKRISDGFSAIGTKTHSHL